MKEQRPGAGTLVEQAADGAAPATPGKKTLVGDLQLMQGGMATIEGGVLFSGPDPTLTATTPAQAPPDKKSDKDFEDAYGITKAITDKTMLPVDGVDGKAFVAKGIAGHAD